MTWTRAEANLSERDRAILRGLAETGYMSGRQIERRWFAGAEVSVIGARRRAQRVLRRLNEQRLVHRLARRQGGSRGGSGAFIYRLDHLGRRAVGLTGRGPWREPAERFVHHCLAVAEIQIGLIEEEKAGELSELIVSHEPDCWRRFLGHSGIEMLKPDLLVELSTPDWQLRWFVEADRATEHLPTVIRKCQLYERYWRSGNEAERYGQEVFPRVLWSVPDRRRAEAVQRAIRRTSNLTDDVFRVAIAEQTPAVLSGRAMNQETKGGER